MSNVLFGAVALVGALGGVAGVYEARSYTRDQRTQAPLLWRAFLGSCVLLCLVGVGSIAWLLGGGTVWAISGILSLACAVPCFVQYRLHRELDIDRSPFTERLGDRITRKRNFPDH